MAFVLCWPLFAVYLALLKDSVSSSEVCPPEWKEFNDSCYLIVTTDQSRDDPKPRDWNAARSYCLNRKADLASFTTARETTFARLFFIYDLVEEFWIGLNNINKTSVWMWSNGDKLNYTYWDLGYPRAGYLQDINRQRCVKIIKRGRRSWRDDECDEKKSWICEKPKNTLFKLKKKTIIATIPGASACPSPKWKGFEDSCYLFTTQRAQAKAMNWTEARTFCLSKGADLVSLTTEKEVSFVYSHTKISNERFWIGLERIKEVNASKTSWKWSNGDRLSITKWQKGEPNLPNIEHCGEILAGLNLWNNKKCETEEAWICEKPKRGRREANSKVVERITTPASQLSSTTTRTNTEIRTTFNSGSTEGNSDSLSTNTILFIFLPMILLALIILIILLVYKTRKSNKEKSLKSPEQDRPGEGKNTDHESSTTGDADTAGYTDLHNFREPENEYESLNLYEDLDRAIIKPDVHNEQLGSYVIPIVAST